MRGLLRTLTGAAFAFGVAACGQLPIPEPDQGPKAASELTLERTEYAALPDWNGDDHAAALIPLLASCEKLKNKDADAAFGRDERMGTVGQWRDICADAEIIRPGNKVEAKYFFETRFMPYRAGDRHDHDGLFTGYYEPELDGRWSPEPTFQLPIYSRPPDIISIDLGQHRAEMAGTQLAGRVEGNKLIPYYSRAEINDGALNGHELEILWVDDAVDRFFLHVQGSGRIKLADGSHVRIGYAGRNGRRYTSIGRELVGMGAMKLEDVTAPSIRDWLKAQPVAGQELMNRNESFVFFRVIEGDGPLGAQGVALTPGRSLAVDRAFLPLGVPVWLDTTDPLTDGAPFRQLVIAQDTGSAIKGPVRGDVFWGFGETAATRAGLMKQDGGYYILLPRAAARVPGEI